MKISALVIAMLLAAVSFPACATTQEDQGNMVEVEITTTTTTKTGVLGRDQLGSSLLSGDSVLGSGGSSLSGAGSDLVGEAHDMGGLITELGARVTARGEIVVVLDTDVFFDFDKSTLKPEAQNTLSKIARLIAMKNPSSTRIDGYTDSKGKDAYNLKLSERRAGTVKNWLVQNGSVPSQKLTIKGYGEENPIAPNADSDGKDNPAGRAKNRRVEVTLEP